MQSDIKLLLILSVALIIGIGSWFWQSGKLCGLSVLKQAPYCRYLKHNKAMQQAEAARRAGDTDTFLELISTPLSPDLYKYLEIETRWLLKYMDEVKAGITTQ